MRHLLLIGLLLMSMGLYAAEVLPDSPVSSETPWAWVVPLVIAVAMAVLKHIQGGKYKKYLDAALQLNRIVYSATEEAGAKEVKDLVRDAVERAASGQISEINDLLVPLVDPKKGESVAPIKRFWRRFLAGENPAGVVARVALNNALAKSLNK